MADAKSGSREGGGRGGSAASVRRPGGLRNVPLRTHADRQARAHPEGTTTSRSRAPLAVNAWRRGQLPSPTPAKGNGARRLRAGKAAFGRSGLRQRPLSNSPRPTATRAALFPPPAHGGEWPAPTAGPTASPCPFSRTH